MTREQTLAALKDIIETMADDPEAAHSTADSVIHQFLAANGFEDIADAWGAAEDAIGFWYA